MSLHLCTTPFLPLPEEWKDPDKFGACCMGAAMYGPEHCTCWSPVYSLEQAPAQVTRALTVERQTGLCGDCAYRKNSPEQADDWEADELRNLAGGDVPFWCHQGMRRVIEYRHPDGRVLPLEADHYEPPFVKGVRGTRVPLRADGTPALICGGWAAMRDAVLAARLKFATEQKAARDQVGRIVTVVEAGARDGHPEGMRYRELADLLGISISAVGQAAHRGRRQGRLRLRIAADDRRIRFVMVAEKPKPRRLIVRP